MKNFFLQLLKNIKNIFWGYNIFWHILLIMLTFILVITNFDWNYFVFMHGRDIQNWFIPAVIFGGIWPFIVSFVLMIMGKKKKNPRLFKIGIILLQSLILAMLISGTYKAFTGRLHPPQSFFHATNLDVLLNTSHNFRFGFWRGGVFRGWPSTHTTISFAFSIAIYRLFPKNKKVRFFAIFYAFYVGLWVSVTSIHWFSEFVAGGILGGVIGNVVWRSGEKGKGA